MYMTKSTSTALLIATTMSRLWTAIAILWIFIVSRRAWYCIEQIELIQYRYIALFGICEGGGGQNVLGWFLRGSLKF